MAEVRSLCGIRRAKLADAAQSQGIAPLQFVTAAEAQITEIKTGSHGAAHQRAGCPRRRCRAEPAAARHGPLQNLAVQNIRAEKRLMRAPIPVYPRQPQGTAQMKMPQFVLPYTVQTRILPCPQ